MPTTYPPAKPDPAAARDRLDELHTLALHISDARPWTLPDRLVDAARRLSPLERATARVTVRRRDDRTLPVIIQSAALRLAILDARGSLPTLSGQTIARTLQSAMGDSHPHALREAAFGWAVLAACDATGTANVNISYFDQHAQKYSSDRLISRIAAKIHNHNI